MKKLSQSQPLCFIPDIGILASTDPVALDKASLDLFESKHGFHAIEHAAALGMGSLEYELVVVE